MTLWKGVTSDRLHLRWLEVPPLGDACCQVPARFVWFLVGRFCWMLIYFGWTSKGGSSKPQEGMSGAISSLLWSLDLDFTL